MKENLLIVGAGIYGLVAQEIAESMGCFDRLSFVDDIAKETVNGTAVVGTTHDLPVLAREYANVIVAIGNPSVRLPLLERIEREVPLRIATLISPRAYVSPTAQIGNGSIIEPLAAVHTNCVIESGCIISAGAVVNHASRCCKGVHVDCNAVVSGNTVVPGGIKITAGTLYHGDENGRLPFAGRENCLENEMRG